MSSGRSSFLTSSTLKIAVTCWPRRSAFGASSVSCGLGCAGFAGADARHRLVEVHDFRRRGSSDAGRRRITSSSALANSGSPCRKVRLVLM